MIANGIRQGQQFAAKPNLMPYADGGEMEGWLNGIHQRHPNGSLDPTKVIPTIQSLINASRLRPHKEILLKAVPGGGFPGLGGRTKPHYWSAAQSRDFSPRQLSAGCVSDRGGATLPAGLHLGL